MGWPVPPAFVTSAEGCVAICSGFHPRFAEALAEHLEVVIFDDEKWQARARRALEKWATEQRAAAAKQRRRTAKARPVSVEFLGGRRVRISYTQKTPPPGWAWDDEPKTLRMTDAGAKALAEAQASDMMVVYVGTGRFPPGWSPPADCPGFIVRALSAAEVRIVEAQVGSEPARPGTPEWECEPDSAADRAWRVWRRWRLRRDTMFNQLAWKGALVGGEQVDPEAFIERVHGEGQVQLANHLFAEAAQHIFRLTYMPASLGKGSAAPSGSAPRTAGGAAPTTASPASGPGSGA